METLIFVFSSFEINLETALSYHDVEELIQIWCVQGDHSTIQRWVFIFGSAIEMNMHMRKRKVESSWRMDETYSKVAGNDRYLYRAVDIQNILLFSSI